MHRGVSSLRKLIEFSHPVFYKILDINFKLYILFMNFVSQAHHIENVNDIC